MSHNHQPNPGASNPEPFLPCERLDVYRVALEFRHTLGVLDTVRNISALRDQVYRAADSVALNIAEWGAPVSKSRSDGDWENAARRSIDGLVGRHARADKRRYYSYALGSASECGAALALLYACGAMREVAYQERRSLIIRIVQMLSRLCGPPR